MQQCCVLMISWYTLYVLVLHTYNILVYTVCISAAYLQYPGMDCMQQCCILTISWYTLYVQCCILLISWYTLYIVMLHTSTVLVNTVCSSAAYFNYPGINCMQQCCILTLSWYGLYVVMLHTYNIMVYRVCLVLHTSNILVYTLYSNAAYFKYPCKHCVQWCCILQLSWHKLYVVVLHTYTIMVYTVCSAPY